ncbi:MAG: hypothetical protein WA019_02340, partial [Candidatus Moraniibacteriota bacterium]
NLVSRVIKLGEGLDYNPKLELSEVENLAFGKLIEKMELGQVLEYIWKKITEANKYIDDNKPWKLIKENSEKFEEVMKKLLEDLNLISQSLAPLMPETSEKIKQALENKKTEILFQRIK